MYFPYVYFGCGLEINAAATAAYVANHCVICDDRIRGMLELTCDCDPLFWTTDATPDPISYNSPAGNSALWYTAALEESAQFLGYRVLDVQRPNQTNRTVTQRLGPSGGGVLGPLRREAIRFDFQVLLFACNEVAMEYGFRFLANRLTCMNLTSDCDRTTLIYRDTCQPLDPGGPTQAEVNAGRWIVNDTLLSSGPVWGEDPLPGMRHYVRRVDFSITGESIAPLMLPT